ncbi:MAG: hypothetical protein ACTSYR_06205 [Candidatus Odinarchaeia archaeon]
MSKNEPTKIKLIRKYKFIPKDAVFEDFNYNWELEEYLVTWRGGYLNIPYEYVEAI